MALLDPGLVRRLLHLHRGGALEQLGQEAGPGRVEVLQDHEGEAARPREVAEELLQRLQSPGRGAEGHDDRLGLGKDGLPGPGGPPLALGAP